MNNFLQDHRAQAVLSKLHDLDRQQSRKSLRFFMLLRLLRGGISDKPVDWRSDAVRTFMRDKLVALDAEKCRLCYMLCRGLGARRVVEVGTSFGVSTIYLAAAVRDNSCGHGGHGIVIGTELEESKAAAARVNLAEAGLADFAEIRQGDVLEILKEVCVPVDLVLLDIWAPLALPALQLLTPQLREGAIVLCDNVDRFSREYRQYVAHVRRPDSGFVSMTLPFSGGFEMSVRLPQPRAGSL